MLDGGGLDEFMDSWIKRRKERKMARKPVYVDVIKIIEYRDDSCEEFATGPSYEVKLQLDVKDFDTCVALRGELLSAVEQVNERHS